MALQSKQILLKIYQTLYDHFGPQYWWPAQTKFEVIIGAILTQNTNWGNVEKALANLKNEHLLSVEALHRLPQDRLASLIKPSGYFNIKAKRIKNFIVFLRREYDGRLEGMSRESRQTLRAKILTVNGIGPETADSILLYALDKPVFVVDAYTKRILYRHSLIGQQQEYASIQKFFMDDLDNDAALFNEYHALIVRLGKEYCKPNPRCEQCPLKNLAYSMKYKCQSCHRALLSSPERRFNPLTKTYLCPTCAE